MYCKDTNDQSKKLIPTSEWGGYTKGTGYNGPALSLLPNTFPRFNCSCFVITSKAARASAVNATGNQPLQLWTGRQ